MVSTFYGGRVAGLISTVLSFLAIDYFFLEPIGTMKMALTDVPMLAVFISLAFLISYLVEIRRRAEEQLRETNAELEQRVSERTAELVKANHVKDEFLAMVSHDLRTPLTSIKGWLRIIDSHPTNQESVTKALGIIERNVNTQVQLVNDLLDVSAIASGGLAMQLRPLEFSTIIEWTAEQLLPLARSRGIDIELRLDKTLDTISGDPDRLSQVVSNLLGNALKFTENGGRVVVSLESVDAEVRLTVTDTGRGIKPQLLPYVFDAFRQDDAARSLGGLGLGLAIVKHIVESHGGRVTAASDGDGKGSTFTFTLPMRAALVEDETVSESSKALAARASTASDS